MDYLRNDCKFRIQVGADSTALFCHQTEFLEPSAALLVEFCPSAVPASRPETLEGYAIIEFIPTSYAFLNALGE